MMWYLETPGLREEQITQSMEALAKGGFKFKHVIRSGEESPEEASTALMGVHARYWGTSGTLRRIISPQD